MNQNVKLSLKVAGSFFGPGPTGMLFSIYKGWIPACAGMTMVFLNCNANEFDRKDEVKKLGTRNSMFVECIYKKLFYA